MTTSDLPPIPVNLVVQSYSGGGRRGQGGACAPGGTFRGVAFQGQPKNLELNFSVSTPLRTTTVVLPLPPSYILQSGTAQLVWWGCKGYNGL